LTVHTRATVWRRETTTQAKRTKQQSFNSRTSRRQTMQLTATKQSVRVCRFDKLQPFQLVRINSRIKYLSTAFSLENVFFHFTWDVKVRSTEFYSSVDTAETDLLIALQPRSATARRPGEVTSATDRRPRRLDVMHWLEANGQPGLPGETPGALAAELELSKHAI